MSAEEVEGISDSDLDKTELLENSEDLPDTQPYIEQSKSPEHQRISGNSLEDVIHLPGTTQETSFETVNSSLDATCGSISLVDTSVYKTSKSIGGTDNSLLDSPVMIKENIKASTPHTSRKDEQDVMVVSGGSTNSVMEISDDSWKSDSCHLLESDKNIISKSPQKSIKSSDESSKSTKKLKNEVAKKMEAVKEENSRLQMLQKARSSKNVTKTTVGCREVFGPFYTEFTCLLDERKQEIISLSISKLQRKEDSKRTSISSGAYADQSSVSGSVYSSNEAVMYPLPPPRLSVITNSSSSSPSSISPPHARLSVMSNVSSSTAASSASALGRRLGKKIEHQFIMPPLPQLKKNSNYSRPQHCVCSCFCDAFFTSESKCRNSGPPTPESLSSSSGSLGSKSDAKNSNQSGNFDEPGPVQSNGINQLQIKGSCLMPELILPEIKDEKQADLHETSDSLLVFGKGSCDTWFSPGILESERTKENLQVKFFNGSVKTVSKANTIPAGAIQKGVEIMYLEGNDKYAIGTVASVESLHTGNVNRDVSLMYTIEKKGVLHKVTFDRVAISDAVYKKLKRDGVLPEINQFGRRRLASHISLENLQEGKRQRTSQTTFRRIPKEETMTKLSSEEPFEKDSTALVQRKRYIADISVPKTIQRLEEIKGKHGGQKGNESSFQGTSLPGTSQVGRGEMQPGQHSSTTHSDMKYTDSDSSESSINLNQVGTFDKEYIPPSQSAKKTIGSRRLKSSSEEPLYVAEDENLVETLGPIPESPIFSDFNFVLTHTIIPPLIGDRSQETDQSKSYSSEYDDENYYKTQIPFDFLRLRVQIIAGKGTMHTYVTDVPKKLLKKTVVITDAPCKTSNYLLSVAQGIPIYRHDLIVNCCHQKKHIEELLQTPYSVRLPNGWSIETREFILAKNRRPFENYRTLIALTENIYTLRVWKKLIECAGGTVILSKKNKFPISFYNISWILGDEKMSPEMKAAAQMNDIPIVTTTWIIECIIHGDNRKYIDYAYYSIKY